MSRPGHNLSRDHLVKMRRLRRKAMKTPQSMSLLSNIKDIDNALQLASTDSNTHLLASVTVANQCCTFPPHTFHQPLYSKVF
jgi:hypothetical protein